MNKQYKNIYMFKNPVRHFLNAENINYEVTIDNIQNNYLKYQCWTKPINFFIRKYYGKDDCRTLKIPNFMNFYISYLLLKDKQNFFEFNKISNFSRVKPNLDTGDFAAYTYEEQLQDDLLQLSKYDKLLIFDIKSFYSSIYTHELQELIVEVLTKDTYITALNDGRTDGILMGNYISLYLAEFLLEKIMSEINQKIKDKDIFAKIKNFSDDIYVFAYNKNIQDIKNIVSKTLQEFSLEINESKTKETDYILYLSENIITKYWRTIINKQRGHEKNIDSYNRVQKDNDKKLLYSMNFLNQLIYRYTLLHDEKNGAILFKNFFKTEFWYELDINKYKISNENIHQLFFIMKNVPETILYVALKMKKISRIHKREFSKFFEQQFAKSVDDDKFYEEQLYFYFGWCMLKGDDDFISDNRFDTIMSLKNQVLQSIIVMGKEKSNIDFEQYLKKGEENWFLNYHLILQLNYKPSKLKKKIKEYLLPKQLENTTSGPTYEAYINFYLKNINNNVPFVKLIEDVEMDIDNYLLLKHEEKNIDNVTSE